MNSNEKIKNLQKFQPKKLGLINPIQMLAGLNLLEFYRVPSLVPPTDPVTILKRHAEELKYNGDYKDGYIFRTHVRAAETIEQQAALRRALDDTIPLDKKAPNLQEVWENMVIKSRPTYMFATVVGIADIHMFSFAPIWQIFKKENGFLIRVGGRKEDLNLDKDIPYFEFESEHLDSSTIQFAYDLFYKLRVDDEKLMGLVLDKGINSIPISPYSIYLDYLFKFGEPTFDTEDKTTKVKTLLYFGKDQLALSRVDPHTGFLMSFKKQINDENEEDDENIENESSKFVQFNLYFEASTPNHAVRATEYMMKQMGMQCFQIPRFPADKERSVLAAMMYHYKAVQAKRYTCPKIKVEKTETSANIYEFVGKNNYVTVLAPIEKDSSLFGYIFDSDANSIIERLVPEDYREESLTPNLVIENDKLKNNKNPQIPERPAKIGEIHFSQEKNVGAVFAFSPDRKRKSEKRLFKATSLDFIDNDNTIAGMAMEFIK